MRLPGYVSDETLACLCSAATAVVLAGQSDDFFGQYRHNSHVVLGVRYSF